MFQRHLGWFMRQLGRRFRTIRVVMVFGVGLACAACGSKDVPLRQQQRLGLLGQLRVNPHSSSDWMTFTSSAGISGTVTKTCDFNRSTLEFSCTSNYSDNRPLAYTAVTTFKFAAVADFVGDAPRVVLVASTYFHPASVVIQIPTPGLQSTANSTYSYDSQKRLTRVATTNSTGGTQNQVVSAWDSLAARRRRRSTFRER